MPPLEDDTPLARAIRQGQNQDKNPDSRASQKTQTIQKEQIEAQIGDSIVKNNPTKSKIKQEIDGREKHKPTTLAEIWGESKRFIDDDKEENKLRQMNLAELHDYGIKHYNLMPKSNREQVISACMKEFKRAKFLNSGGGVTERRDGMSAENRKQALDLMKRSR